MVTPTMTPTDNTHTTPSTPTDAGPTAHLKQEPDPDSERMERIGEGRLLPKGPPNFKG